MSPDGAAMGEPNPLLVKTRSRELEEALLTQSLTSFLPRLALRRIAADPTPVEEPRMQQFAAALLLADISGFTVLAEQLGRRGPEGAEALTAILNRFFEQIIGLVHSHGGDVVKFTGDGLLALWPTLDGSLEKVTTLAAQCALAMQARLHDFDAGEGIRLSLHSGISAGEVFVYDIGGVRKRWESLVFGAPLSRISVAARQAQRGEIVLSAEAWNCVKETCSGEPLAGGQARLERVTAPQPLVPARAPVVSGSAAAAMRAFIPNAVLARLAGGQPGWLSELRLITVLFVNLPDLTQSFALERAQAVMEATQRALYRFEGSIGQLSVDDKGIGLVGALGLPPLAHEDDALRGVQAALGIQAALRDLGIRSGIGVSTGRVFCGAVGGAGRRHYAMVGDVVNVAARLMQAAPGDILCDAATHRAALHRLQFEPLPPLKMKGRDEPVPVYRPYCPVPVTAGLRPMFGREVEQAAFARLLEKAKGGHGGIAIVEGEPGIGKSRLVAAVRAEAGRLGIHTLAGAGDGIEKSTPYHAWRPVFTQIFGVDEHNSTAVRRAKVSEWLSGDDEALCLAPLLNSVLALDLADNEITSQMRGQTRADNTHDLLLRLLELEACRTPAVLLLEDAHWLDPASWGLALLVAHRLPSLLLIMATRPLAEPPPEFRQLVSMAGSQHFRLDALSGSVVVEILCERLGARALPPELVRLIQQKAQGNPFFSEELVHALRESGLILIENGECRLAPGVDLSTVSFPDSVQGVITSRMDRLPTSQQLTLKVASVIGRIFPLRVLRDIFPISAERKHLPAHLEQLHQLDLTPLCSPEPELAYIFKHVITQEVAYNLMLFSQRRQLHRAAAEWYEAAQKKDLAQHFPLLAHHWQGAEDTVRAVAYFERAGEEAMKNGTFDGAVKFFTLALELERRIAGEATSFGRRLRRARWESALGDALMGLGQLPKSRLHCQRAVAHLGEALPATRIGVALRLIFDTARQLAFSLWRPLRLEVAAHPGDYRCVVGSTLERLGQLDYYAANIVTGWACVLRAITVSEPAGISSALARHYATACIAFSLLRWHRIAARYAARAEQCGELLQDQPSLVWIYQLNGLSELGLGHWEKGAGKLLKAIGLAERIGDWRRWAESTVNLTASFHLSKGLYRQCLSIFQQVRATAAFRGDAQALIWGHVGMALAHFRLGELESAATVLEAAKELITGATAHSELTWLHGVRASVYFRQGRTEEALAAAEAVLEMVESAYPVNNWILEGLAGMAETFCGLAEEVAAGRFPAARLEQDRGTRGCAHLRRWTRVFPFAASRSLLCDARLARLNGQPRQAQKLLGQALASAEKMEMPLEQATAHFELARLLPRTSPARAGQLATASEIFERLSAPHELERLRALEAKSDAP